MIKITDVGRLGTKYGLTDKNNCDKDGTDCWFRGKDLALSLLPDGTLDSCDDFDVLFDLVTNGDAIKVESEHFYTLETTRIDGSLTSTNHSRSLDALRAYARFHEGRHELAEISFDAPEKTIVYQTSEKVRKCIIECEKAEKEFSERWLTAIAIVWVGPDGIFSAVRRSDSDLPIEPGEILREKGPMSKNGKPVGDVAETEDGRWVGFESQKEMLACWWLKDEREHPLPLMEEKGK
jgi:hypothetical protein